jgi:hypothetical protein
MIRGGPGVFYSCRNGQTVIEFKQKRVASTPPSPWAIKTQTDQNGNLQWAVTYDSALFNSLRPRDTQNITGLLSDPITATDSAWVGVSASQGTNDLIWLEIGFNTPSFSISSATIKTLGNGGTLNPALNAWNSGAYLESTSSTQTARILIGWAENPAGTAPTVYQGLTSNLLLQNVVVDGIATRWAFPWDGGYQP